MTRPWLTTRVVDAASAIAIVAAVLLAVLPARDIASSRTARTGIGAQYAVPGPGDTSATGALDSSAVQIVRGNVFSSTRRAPSSRFLPPGTESVAMSTAPGTYESNPVATPAFAATPHDPDAVPRLYGVVTVDGVRRALLALRTGEPPRLFGLDERYAGYRVRVIEQDRVVLDAAGGSRTLRLTRPASRDTSRNLP